MEHLIDLAGIVVVVVGRHESIVTVPVYRNYLIFQDINAYCVLNAILTTVADYLGGEVDRRSIKRLPCRLKHW